MRVLQVTFEPPSEKSGGGMGIIQSAVGLQHNAEVIYCGPAIQPSLNGIIKSYSETFTLKRSVKLLDIINSFIHLAPTNYYVSWLHEKTKIEKMDYDAVYIDFSRHGFVAKWAKQHKKNVIIRVHNIEKDYFKKSLRNRFSVSSLLRYLMICHQERQAVKYATKLICITEEDKKRLLYLYGLDENNIIVSPVCLKEKNTETVEFNDLPKKYVLYTGSLWYGQNLDGILWYIRNVHEIVSKKLGDYRLVIAGSNPSVSLKKTVDNHDNIELYDTPDKISPFFSNASIYIAPVFDGAGMKVKVAEAFSYGIPVVGTKHALIGYEEMQTEKYEANTPEEFVESISLLWNLENSDKNIMKEKILGEFKKLYSISRYVNDIRNILVDEDE